MVGINNGEEYSGQSAPESSESHEEQIGRLFREHNQVLLQFLMARLHSEQEAKEVAQEAYVRLLNLDKPDAVSYLRAYLFKTAANLANDRFKQRTRRERIDELLFFDSSVTSPSPEANVAALEELNIMRDAVAELPPKARKAFILHKFHDLGFAEVAARMALSERMVRLYITRALVHCKQRLETRRANVQRENGDTTHE